MPNIKKYEIDPEQCYESITQIVKPVEEGGQGLKKSEALHLYTKQLAEEHVAKGLLLESEISAAFLKKMFNSVQSIYYQVKNVKEPKDSAKGRKANPEVSEKILNAILSTFEMAECVNVDTREIFEQLIPRILGDDVSVEGLRFQNKLINLEIENKNLKEQNKNERKRNDTLEQNNENLLTQMNNLQNTLNHLTVLLDKSSKINLLQESPEICDEVSSSGQRKNTSQKIS